jgi:CRP/FNR family transcriptional regulator
MLGNLSQFLHKYNRMIEELSFQDVSSRLARYLIRLWEKGGKNQEMEIELEMSKTQLASHLGTISETLSRTLKKFKDNHLINVKKNRIRLIDFDKIEAISWGQKM